MPSRLAVLMVADVVDYSCMMEADEAAAIQHVRSLKQIYLEPKVLSRGGEILKRIGGLDHCLFIRPHHCGVRNRCADGATGTSGHKVAHWRPHQ